MTITINRPIFNDAPDDIIFMVAKGLGVFEDHEMWLDDQWPDKMDDLIGRIYERIDNEVPNKTQA